MQPEPTPRLSFFDDDDLNIRFDFVKPDKNHLKYLNSPPSIKDPLSRFPTNSEPSQNGFYALHTKLLAFYEVKDLLFHIFNLLFRTLLMSKHQHLFLILVILD